MYCTNIMTELKLIFDAFDKYEEALSNEVDYKIKMRNDKRKIGNAMGNKDFRIIINKMKAKEALFDNIRKFMTQNKVAQNKVAQNKVAQNKMTQNKMTHNSRSKKNRRSTVV